jgi:hypothetical protein
VFSQSFSPITFDITGLNIPSFSTDVRDLSVALTSSTPQNKTYHIKGGRISGDPSVYINTGTPIAHSASSVPEPSSFVLGLLALVPLGALLSRRRRPRN